MAMKVFSGYFFSADCVRHNFDKVCYNEEELKKELEKKYNLPIFLLVYQELINGDYEENWTRLNDYGYGNKSYTVQVKETVVYDPIVIRANSKAGALAYFKKHRAEFLNKIACNEQVDIEAEEKQV